MLVLGLGEQQPRHTEEDLEVAVDLGRRAGLILHNARFYEQQHTIAAMLQDSLVPDLPVIPRIRSAARYRAAASGAQVGGDFYELIELPDASIGVAIGNVVSSRTVRLPEHMTRAALCSSGPPPSDRLKDA